MPHRTRWLARLDGAALGLAVLLLAGAPHVRADGAEPPVVFGAASTTAALSELAAIHERRQGRALRLSFASSATLARQVINGARPALFLSANRRWMDALDDAGLLVAGTRRELLGNRLVLIRHRGSDHSVNLAEPDTLLGALGDAPLVLGDPAHVPAGLYAREALRRLGLWERLQGRLAFAANARAVTVRVARGDAPLGITYASELAGDSRIEAAATIPPDAHAPIRYEVALVAPESDPEARAFFNYLFSGEAQRVFLNHGFTPGNEGILPSGKAGTPSLPGKAGTPSCPGRAATLSFRGKAGRPPVPGSAGRPRFRL